MGRRRAVAKHFLVALLGAAVALAAIGAIFAALTGRQAWHSIAWTFIIGGGVLCVLNVAGSGSGQSPADPRTGTGFGGVAPDASPPGGLILGLVLVGLGAAALFA